MTRLLEIGERHNIPVIEDAAEAIGSKVHGNRAGSMGKFGCFSFHGSKTLTTGEGGMFVTDDADLYEKVLTLSNHGRAQGQRKQFWPETVGFKYKMSNIQAAIGCAQLERVEELIRRKQDILQYYRSHLEDLTVVSLNPEPPGTVHGAWMPTAIFDAQCGVDSEYIHAAFTAENIDARAFFSPLSSLPMFADLPHNRVARELAGRAINLPSFHDMTTAEQDRIVEVVRRLARH
jgi:perosamine synthetase